MLYIFIFLANVNYSEDTVMDKYYDIVGDEEQKITGLYLTTLMKPSTEVVAHQDKFGVTEGQIGAISGR